MTEKRFTIDEDGNITDTKTDRTLYVENRYTASNYYVNLLNELNEENEQLKKRINELELLNDGLNYALQNIRKIDVEIDLND